MTPELRAAFLIAIDQLDLEHAFLRAARNGCARCGGARDVASPTGPAVLLLDVPAQAEAAARVRARRSADEGAVRFCAICTDETDDLVERPLGRNDALVSICRGCDDDHPRQTGPRFSSSSLGGPGRDGVGEGNRALGNKHGGIRGR